MFRKKRHPWQEQLGQNRTVLKEKLQEAMASVLPITAIVLVLCFSIAPIPTATFMTFLIGAVLLILGMGLFTLGADTAMTPIGERVGAHMTRSRKLWVVITISFLIGVIVTVSEPDLQVLAEQVPSVPNAVLVGAVAIGVGAFLVISLLRILFRVPLQWMLVGFYIVVFALSLFVPKDFLAIAFDSGGVTTGPMTVPFIMALGLGVASIRSDENAAQDSFGLVALCSIGPILAVMVLALIYSLCWSLYAGGGPAAEDTVPCGHCLGGLSQSILRRWRCVLRPCGASLPVFQVYLCTLKEEKSVENCCGSLIYLCGAGSVSDGSQCGLYPGGQLSGPADCRPFLSLDSHSNWYADGLVHCAGGAGSPCAEQAGGGDYLRSNSGKGNEYQPFRGRGNFHRPCHGAGSYWGSPFFGLWCRGIWSAIVMSFFLCTEDIHGNCL